MTDRKQTNALKLNKKSVGRLNRGVNSPNPSASSTSPLSVMGLSFCCCTK